MKPDATLHNPDPQYIRSLLAAAGLSQEAAARQVGISGRAMRNYVSGERDAPYSVQFALESLAPTAR